MSEKRQIKLEMQVDNEDCDVVTKVTDTMVTYYIKENQKVRYFL